MEKLLGPRLLGITILSFGFLLPGCATGPSHEEKEYAGEAGTSGQIAGILLTQSLNQSGAPKVIIASYRVSATGFTATQSLVSFGSQGSLGGGGDDYAVELVGRDGQVLLKYGIWDPRKAVVEKQGIVVNPEGVLAARFPFRPEADKVRVRDKSNAIVAETDVRSLVLAFCARLKDDADCAKVLRDR